MTAKQEVKAKWPDAMALLLNNTWNVFSTKVWLAHSILLGKGMTLDQAWADAATRIRQAAEKGE